MIKTIKTYYDLPYIFDDDAQLKMFIENLNFMNSINRFYMAQYAEN